MIQVLPLLLRECGVRDGDLVMDNLPIAVCCLRWEIGFPFLKQIAKNSSMRAMTHQYRVHSKEQCTTSLQCKRMKSSGSSLSI